MKKIFTLITTLLSILMLFDCSKKTTPFEYFPDMADNFAIESQEADYFSENKSGSRIPPVGTIPYGYEPYPYTKEINIDGLTQFQIEQIGYLPSLDDRKVTRYATARDLPNPEKGLINPFNEKVTSMSRDEKLSFYKRGEERYQIYCSPCHGVRGAGNGNIVGPSPKFGFAVPALIMDEYKNWTDGQLYHTITEGKGSMNSYAYQVESEDRWKIVMYIRKLQEASKN